MQMSGLNVAAVFIFYHFNAKNKRNISVLTGNVSRRTEISRWNHLDRKSQGQSLFT